MRKIMYGAIIIIGIVVMLCILCVAEVHSGTVLGNLNIQDNVFFNADSTDSTIVWVMCRGTGNDIIAVIDTLGFFRITYPITYFDRQVKGDTVVVLKRLYAISDKGDTTFAWADTASGIWVKDATWISEFQSNLWKSYAPTCPDSEFTETGSISFIGKADTASGNPITIVETPINLQVQGSWVGDGILPNYWLGVKRGAADPFLYLYGNSGSTLAAKLLGSMEIYDTTDIASAQVGLKIRVNSDDAQSHSITAGLNKDVPVEQHTGVNVFAYDTSGSGRIIGVKGQAESENSCNQSLYGGWFGTQPCGLNKHYGLYGYGWADVANDSDCYGIYGEANHEGGGNEIGIYGKGDIAVYADGKIIGNKVTEQTFYAPSEHITAGTVVSNKVTLGTATNTYFNATPQWKAYGQPFIIDSLQVYYYVVAHDTIDQIQLEEMSNSGAATAKYNYTTDIFTVIAPANGSVTLADSSFNLTGQPYRLNLLTKGAGGDGIYHYGMFMHQEK